MIKSVVLGGVLPFVLLAVGAALLVAFIAVLCVLMIPLLPFAFVALSASGRGRPLVAPGADSPISLSPALSP